MGDHWVHFIGPEVDMPASVLELVPTAGASSSTTPPSSTITSTSLISSSSSSSQPSASSDIARMAEDTSLHLVANPLDWFAEWLFPSSPVPDFGAPSPRITPPEYSLSTASSSTASSSSSLPSSLPDPSQIQASSTWTGWLLNILWKRAVGVGNTLLARRAALRQAEAQNQFITSNGANQTNHNNNNNNNGNGNGNSVNTNASFALTSSRSSTAPPTTTGSIRPSIANNGGGGGGGGILGRVVTIADRLGINMGKTLSDQLREPLELLSRSPVMQTGALDVNVSHRIDPDTITTAASAAISMFIATQLMRILLARARR